MADGGPAPRGPHEPRPFSSAESFLNRPQDPRALGMVAGGLLAAAFGGLIVLIATSAGNAPFQRIGMSQGGALFLYPTGAFVLGRVAGVLAARVERSLPAAGLGAATAVLVYSGVVSLLAPHTWVEMLAPAAIVGAVLGWRLVRSRGR